MGFSVFGTQVSRGMFFLAGPLATQNGQVGERAKIKKSTYIDS